MLVDCPHHASAPPALNKGLPPPTGYYLVLREGGAVNRVEVNQIRWFPLPGPRPRFLLAFPSEPGYEGAGR